MAKNDAPKCRYCGKPLKRWISTEFLSDNESGALGERPTLRDARRILGRHVTKIYTVEPGRHFERDDGKPKAIAVWDGKRWGHRGKGHFCKGHCAEEFGYAVAHHTKLIAYREDAPSQQATVS